MTKKSEKIKALEEHIARVEPLEDIKIEKFKKSEKALISGEIQAKIIEGAIPNDQVEIATIPNDLVYGVDPSEGFSAEDIARSKIEASTGYTAIDDGEDAPVGTTKTSTFAEIIAGFAALRSRIATMTKKDTVKEKTFIPWKEREKKEKKEKKLRGTQRHSRRMNRK